MALAVTKISTNEYLGFSNEKLEEKIIEGLKKIKKRAVSRIVIPRKKTYVPVKENKTNLFYKMKRNEESNEDSLMVEIVNNKLFQDKNYKKMKNELLSEFKNYFIKIHKEIIPIGFKEFE